VQEQDFHKKEGWIVFVQDQIEQWKKFHEYYLAMEECRVHFFRYEDLLSDSEKELTEIFKFVLDVDTLEGTQVETNIRLLAQNSQKQVHYKPRSGGALGKNLYRFKEVTMSDGKSLFEYVKQECGDILRIFGYSDEFDLAAIEHDFTKVNQSKR